MPDKRSISRVFGSKLKVIGSLDFDHKKAPCDVMGTDKIFLCFNDLDSRDFKRCRMTSDPLGNFSEIQESTFPHRRSKNTASDCK